MKTTIIGIVLLLTFQLSGIEKVIAQTPVTDVGAGIQREALWKQEKGILAKINWYNVLIKALNGDIKGLTGEMLGIDQKMLESLLSTCRPKTRLCIACDITLETEYIITKTVAQWKSGKLPDIQKRPAIFLILG